MCVSSCCGKKPAESAVDVRALARKADQLDRLAKDIKAVKSNGNCLASCCCSLVSVMGGLTGAATLFGAGAVGAAAAVSWARQQYDNCGAFGRWGQDLKNNGSEIASNILHGAQKICEIALQNDDNPNCRYDAGVTRVNCDASFFDPAAPVTDWEAVAQDAQYYGEYIGLGVAAVATAALSYKLGQWFGNALGSAVSNYRSRSVLESEPKQAGCAKSLCCSSTKKDLTDAVDEAETVPLTSQDADSEIKAIEEGQAKRSSRRSKTAKEETTDIAIEMATFTSTEEASSPEIAQADVTTPLLDQVHVEIEAHVEATETPVEVQAEATETLVEVQAEATETPVEVQAEATETLVEVQAEVIETPVEIQAEANAVCVATTEETIEIIEENIAIPVSTTSSATEESEVQPKQSRVKFPCLTSKTASVTSLPELEMQASQKAEVVVAVETQVEAAETSTVKAEQLKKSRIKFPCLTSKTTSVDSLPALETEDAPQFTLGSSSRKEKLAENMQATWKAVKHGVADSAKSAQQSMSSVSCVKSTATDEASNDEYVLTSRPRKEKLAEDLQVSWQMVKHSVADKARSAQHSVASMSCIQPSDADDEHEPSTSQSNKEKLAATWQTVKSGVASSAKSAKKSVQSVSCVRSEYEVTEQEGEATDVIEGDTNNPSSEASNAHARLQAFAGNMSKRLNTAKKAVTTTGSRTLSSIQERAAHLPCLSTPESESQENAAASAN